MRINHNLAALNTYNKLSVNQGATSNSLARLSSGLAINSASDNAAGLAISEKMRGQIRGLNQAESNSNDGISLIQTAEGGLNETHSILQRMRELAVQAANDTNTTSDRREMQKEIEQLTEEITRISTDTEFNTRKLLDGSMASTVQSSTLTTGVTAKVAAGSSIKSGTYNVTITDYVAATEEREASTVSLSGIYNGTSDEDFTYKTISDDAVAADGWYADGQSTATTLSTCGITTSGTIYSGAVIEARYHTGTPASSTAVDPTYATPPGTATATVNSATLIGALGVNAPAGVPYGSTRNASDIVVNATAANAFTLTAKGVSVGTGITSANLSIVYGFTLTAGAIPIKAGDTFTFTLTGVEGAGTTMSVIQSGVILPAEESYEVSIKDSEGKSMPDSSLDFEFATSLDSGTPISGNITIESSKALVLQIGANSGQNTTLSVNNMSAENLGVGDLGLTTQKRAAGDITKIDKAITSVSAQRAVLGASQNRLEHTINGLETTSENMSASESQIRDVDMAKEMMEFTKNNILTQAAQSMLAQANQQPQNVLQLLQ